MEITTCLQCPGSTTSAARAAFCSSSWRRSSRPAGEVFNAPTDLQLSDFDIVQPELLVILGEPGTYVTPTKIIGPPALVVEILSPSTSHRDRSLKFDLYARVEVAEYWIADPEEREVERYVLEDDG